MTVTGGRLWNATPITTPRTAIKTIEPIPGNPIQVNQDFYDLNAAIPDVLPAGTPFQVDVTSAAGNAAYTLLSNASTTSPSSSPESAPILGWGP